VRTIARNAAVFLGLAAAAVACAPSARADYAVLRSGQRLHITGYQLLGDRVRLTIQGGVVEIPAAEMVSVEPEDSFPAPPAPSEPALGAPFADLIHASAQKHGVDEKLIVRVIAAESNFNPKAVSRKRAQGLMQLIPETAAKFSVADVFDPAQNIEAGTRYLQELLERYGGNLTLALAAYNAGPDAVERYGGVPPFPETRNYVKSILSKLSPAEPHP